VADSFRRRGQTDRQQRSGITGEDDPKTPSLLIPPPYAPNFLKEFMSHF